MPQKEKHSAIRNKTKQKTNKQTNQQNKTKHLWSEDFGFLCTQVLWRKQNEIILCFIRIIIW